MKKMIILSICSIMAILVGISVGSVYIPQSEILMVFSNKIFSTPIPSNVEGVVYSLVINIRTPRVIMAFLVGASMSISGTVMQSILNNPLASPFNIGISAGAGVGAAVVIVLGLSSSLLGVFFMPAISLIFALITVIIVILFAKKIDTGFSNTTIILVGMVVSLFLNAIMSMLSTISPNYAQRITLWQLGSFSSKDWRQISILLPVVILCGFVFWILGKELDIISFGEEQAQAMGVNLKKVKWVLMVLVAFLTGTTTAFVGIIGFVDLVSPHLMRRIFGAKHKCLIPASALFGGTFMVLCDLVGRTIAAPREISIGVITALIGAPFFIYFYATSQRKSKV